MTEERATAAAPPESFGVVGVTALAPPGARLVNPANALTVLAMAALGLGVDVRVVARAGGRVAVAVTLSLAVLGAISLAVIFGLRIV